MVGSIMKNFTNRLCEYNRIYCPFFWPIGTESTAGSNSGMFPIILGLAKTV